MAVTGMLTLPMARSSACASRSGRVRSTFDEAEPVAFRDGVQAFGRQHGLLKEFAGRAPVRHEFDHQRFFFSAANGTCPPGTFPTARVRGGLHAPPDGAAYHKERERARKELLTDPGGPQAAPLAPHPRRQRADEQGDERGEPLRLGENGR